MSVMSWLTRLVDRIDAKLDKPADQSLLDNPGGGSERMPRPTIPISSALRRRSARSNRMRQRWLGNSRR